MRSYSINLPSHMRIGSGASQELPQVLKELKLSNPLVMTDKAVSETSGFLDFIQHLSSAGVDFGLYSQCEADPSTASIDLAFANWIGGKYDCVVGFGGGSSIDSAKALAVLVKNGGHLRDYRFPFEVIDCVPIIAIPTTAGTGSEATKVFVITDSETNEKMVCMGKGILPDAALIDFQLTLTMPERLTIWTAIDSLCHAMEAYVSRKANPFTDEIALSALRLISSNIRTVVQDPHNQSAREAMMLAATQAGIAFSNSSVTLIHGMSRPIGAAFHVPHGLSNAMLMPIATEFSIRGNEQRYAECAFAMGVAPNQSCDKEAAELLVEHLHILNAELRIPGPSEYGINKDSYFKHIPQMVKQAQLSGSPQNNPIIPSDNEIAELYRSLWNSSHSAARS